MPSGATEPRGRSVRGNPASQRGQSAGLEPRGAAEEELPPHFQGLAMPKGEPEERPVLPRAEGSGTDPLARSQPRAGALGCARKSRQHRGAAGPGRGEGPAEQTRGSGEGGAAPRQETSARGPGLKAGQETRGEVDEKAL